MEYLENEVVTVTFDDTSFTLLYDNGETEIVKKNKEKKERK